MQENFIQKKTIPLRLSLVTGGLDENGLNSMKCLHGCYNCLERNWSCGLVEGDVLLELALRLQMAIPDSPSLKAQKYEPISTLAKCQS